MSKDIITKNKQSDKGNNQKDRQNRKIKEEFKPNFTMTPNYLFDELLPKMKGSELKVTMILARKTYGWHKKQDEISLSQFMELTGMSRQSVINGLEDGIKRGTIIKVEKGDSKSNSNIYALNLYEDEPEEQEEEQQKDQSEDELIEELEGLKNQLVKKLDQLEGGENQLVKKLDQLSSQLVKKLDTQNKGLNKEREKGDFTGKKSQNPSVKEEDYSPTEKKVIENFNSAFNEDISHTQATEFIDIANDIKKKYGIDISHFELIKDAIDRAKGKADSPIDYIKSILKKWFFKDKLPSYFVDDETDNSNSNSKSKNNNNNEKIPQYHRRLD